MISLIILPFHKHLDTGFAHSGIRIMNKNVIGNAPCSIGIIIDPVLGGVLDNTSSYHVAVVLLGGADDREALAYAERISEHPNIKVIVIRLLKNSCEYNLKKMSAENRFDEETLMDFKLRTTYNKRVTYIQEEEKIMRAPYGEKKEYFKYSLFLVFCNRIMTYVVSAAALLASKKALDTVAPIYKYCLISVSNILTTTCQYEALKYVRFLVQTLAKCAKMIPVM
ncbi:hypothetical protein IFM89_018644, partial [Coptis chinensis]